jgi:hypothetical protein
MVMLIKYFIIIIIIIIFIIIIIIIIIIPTLQDQFTLLNDLPFTF